MPVSFYAAHRTASGGHFLVIGDDVSHDGTPFAEAFLLSEKPPRLRLMTINRPQPLAQEVSGLMDIHEEALDVVQNMVDYELLGWQRPAGMPLPEQVSFARVPDNLLVRLWMRGLFEREIRSMVKLARSTDLKEITASVERLPRLAHTVAGAGR